MKCIVVIGTYNEAENIPSLLPDILHLAPHYEVIVVVEMVQRVVQLKPPTKQTRLAAPSQQRGASGQRNTGRAAVLDGLWAFPLSL